MRRLQPGERSLLLILGGLMGSVVAGSSLLISSHPGNAGSSLKQLVMTGAFVLAMLVLVAGVAGIAINAVSQIRELMRRARAPKQASAGSRAKPNVRQSGDGAPS